MEDRESEESSEIVGLEEIRAARERIRPHAHVSPVQTSSYFNDRFGAELFFKCENFQKTGSFKFRGAVNAVLSLPDEQAARGVVTDSSGNHGQALAKAASLRGIPAHIVMPNSAPAVKIAAVKGYGGRVALCEPDMEARRAAVREIVAETGAEYISSCSHPAIIAGQATATAELLEEVGKLDFVLTPIGGGGLLAGTVLAASFLAPGTEAVGCEPEIADDAFRSLRSGRMIPSNYPPTVADGLRVSLGELPFKILSERGTRIVTVSESAIVSAMREAWERMKIIIEPSSAVVLAAMEEDKLEFTGRRTGLIVSGGNVNLDHLPWQRQPVN